MGDSMSAPAAEVDPLLAVGRVLASHGFASECKRLPFLSPAFHRDKALLLATRRVRYGEMRRTRLMSLSRAGNAALVGALLVDAGGTGAATASGSSKDVNTADSDGWTALLTASFNGRGAVVALLLEHGAKADARLHSGCTSLHAASQNGHESVVRLLLAHRLCAPLTGAKRRDGTTPLHMACAAGHTAVVRLLLEGGGGAALNARNAGRSTPLHIAAQEGHEGAALLLLQDRAEAVADILGKDSAGCTPFHFACSRGLGGLARALLDKGAALEAEDNSGCTPVYHASAGGHGDVLRMILERGAKPNSRNRSGQTGLHAASEMGHEGVVSALLDNGAAVDALTEQGVSALHIACDMGHAGVSRLLAAKGAALNAKSKDGDSVTPLIRAVGGNHVEVVSVLLDAGADTAAAVPDGRTALHVASSVGLRSPASSSTRAPMCTSRLRGGSRPSNGHVEVVGLLLERGADVATKGSNGLLPLHIAVMRSPVAAVRLLLDAGASVNARCTPDGDTGLHFACGRGNVEQARFLLERGADATLTNRSGKTPLALAVMLRMRDVAKLLVEEWGVRR
jgi:ankyrin repeat protein